MVQLIVGVKGAGKTKKMLDHVHDSIKTWMATSYILTNPLRTCMNWTTKSVLSMYRNIRFRIQISSSDLYAESALRIMIFRKYISTVS